MAVSMPSVFLGDHRRRKCFASGLQETKTALCVTTPPLPWRGGESAAGAQLAEMLSTADLNKVIDLPGTTEKQNKIESIELEAIEALSGMESPMASPNLAESLRQEITDLTKSGW